MAVILKLSKLAEVVCVPVVPNLKSVMLWEEVVTLRSLSCREVPTQRSQVLLAMLSVDPSGAS